MSKDLNEKDVQLQKYEKEYSESNLWDKIAKVAKKAGREVVYNALLLFYALQSDKVSVKEKAMIIGALGYFILPIDLIPDAIIGLGFTDDLAVIVAVLKQLDCIDANVKAQAENKMKEWFD